VFGREQALHQLEGGHKEGPVAALDEGMADCAEQMGFTPPWQAKGEDIVTPFNKVPLTQRG
jgi:hypothetical protein